MAPIMREIKKAEGAELQIVATNMHLSPEYGYTITEIEADGFEVDAKIESLVKGGDSAATVRSMAKAQEGLADAFAKLKPDMVVILGDRYEALASASAAVVFNIPVVHLHGGEITEGAIDDLFRNAITKLSTYHFASTPQYVGNIINMGASSENVFHSGAPGADVGQDSSENCQEEGDRRREDFERLTGIRMGEPFIIMAFHPVTMLEDKGCGELSETISALNAFINQGYKILVTMPNSDPGTYEIIRQLEEWREKQNGRVVTVKSMGSRLFHYAMENAMAIVGNSSAALIEAPTYRLGAVNVGYRQKGRAHGITVIDAQPEKEKIEKAMEAILSMEMKACLLGMGVSSLNPYYKEGSSKFIAEKLLTL